MNDETVQHIYNNDVDRTRDNPKDVWDNNTFDNDDLGNSHDEDK